MSDISKRVEEIEGRALEDAASRRRIRQTLLARLAKLHAFSKTLVPCLQNGVAEAVDVERLGILVISLLEAARNEHDAMVADAEARS